MKSKKVKLFLIWSLISLGNGAMVLSVQPYLEHPASLATLQVPGANTVIINPLPVTPNRLFAFVQDGRWTHPMLFDFKSGRTQRFEKLIKNGRVTPTNVRYASDLFGCIYFTHFAAKKPSFMRFCPSTEKISFISLTELNTPPYSFAIDAQGFIYGSLPVQPNDRRFIMVKIAPNGTLLKKKNVTANVNTNFQGRFQPLVTLASENVFVFWRNTVYMLDNQLNILKSYEIPGFGVRRVINVLPFKRKGTFLIHVVASRPQRASRGQVIVRDELYIWTQGSKPLRLNPKSPKDLPNDARILSIAPNGFIFWAKGAILSISTIAGL